MLLAYSFSHTESLTGCRFHFVSDLGVGEKHNI